MQNKVILGYWPTRGRAQFSRFLLEYCEIPYENKMYSSPQEWFGKDSIELQKKGFIFTNLPYLIDGEFMLSESEAIEMYIIKKGKKRDQLLGIGLQQQAQIAMLAGFVRDLGTEALKLNMSPFFDRDSRNVWNNEIQWRLDILEAQISEKGNFLLGKKPTYADFVLFEILQYIRGIWPNGYAKFEKVGALAIAFEILPQINQFINSDRFIKFPMGPPSLFRFTGIPAARLVLGYWGGTRYRVQLSRLLLQYTNQDYEEKSYFKFEDWFEKDCPALQQQGFVFTNLPYLIDGQKAQLSEASAIERYIIKRAGIEFTRELLGENKQEQAQIMMLHGVINDFREEMVKLSFNKEFKNIKMQAWEGWIKGNLQLFSKCLADNRKFIFGNNVTYADFVMYEAVDFAFLMFPNEFKEFNKLRNFMNNFEQLEKIRIFQNSSQYIKVPFFFPQIAAWSGVDAVNQSSSDAISQQPKQQQNLPKLNLGYWGGTRFRAQVSRLLMEYTAQEYEETPYFKPEDWFGKDVSRLNQKGFLFTNLPYLLDGESVQLSEAPAIEHYIMRRAGSSFSQALLGQTIQEQANIRMLHGVINDFREEMVKLSFNPDFQKIKEKAWEEWVKSNLELFSKSLGEGRKFLFGNNVTYADFGLYEAVDFAYLMFKDEKFKEFQILRKFQHNFEQLDRISQFINSSRYIKVPFFFPQISAWSGSEYLVPLPKVVLGYWGGTRFRVQVSRLLLEFTKQDYEEKLYYSKEEWFGKDAPNFQSSQNFVFTNLPYLLDGDKAKLSEAPAIEHYIMRRAGSSFSGMLLGQTIQEQANIKMLHGVINDFREQMVQLSFNPDFQKIKEKAWEEWVKSNLELFSKSLGEGRKFLFGNNVTYADFVLYEAVDFAYLMFKDEKFKEFQALRMFQHNFEQLEQIQQFFNSGRYIKVPFFFPQMAAWSGVEYLAEQPKVVLGYWGGIRFRAQVSRLLLEFTNQEYEQKLYYKPEDWFGRDVPQFNQQGFVFPNLPYLTEGANLKLSEAPAIEHYIIKRAGAGLSGMLLGNTAQEQANIRMLHGVINDFRDELVKLSFNPDFQKIKEKAWEEWVKSNLELLSKSLGEKAFLFGNHVTYADFGLYEAVDFAYLMFKDEKFKEFQTLRKFQHNFEQLDRIKQFVNSSRYIKVPFFYPQMSAWSGAEHIVQLPKVVLGYWGGTRFRVQVSRLLLQYTGQDYDEKLYTSKEEWFGVDVPRLQNSENFIFTNLPYLLDGNQAKLSEAPAIEHYIMRRAGNAFSSELLGNSVQEQANIKMLHGVINDFREELVKLSFNPDFQNVKEKAWEEWVKSNLDLLNKSLGDDRKFLFGNVPTYADFVLYEAFDFAYLMFIRKFEEHQFQLQFSRLLTFQSCFEQLDKIKAFITSDKYIRVPFFFPSLAAWSGLPKLVLGYWGIRFRAQVARLLLEFTHQDYEEKKYLAANEWFQKDSVELSKKYNFKFANLPYLIDGDQMLSESLAIEEYIVNRAGSKYRRQLLGDSAQERATILMLRGVMNDMREALVDLSFDEKFAEKKEQVWENVVKGTLEVVQNHLGTNNFFTGNNVSYADFVMYEGIDFARRVYQDKFVFKNLAKFLNRFEELDGIKQYMESDRCIKIPFFPPGIAQWTGL